MKLRMLLLTIALGLLTACALPDPRGAAAPTSTGPTSVAQPSTNVIADAVVLPERYVDLTFDAIGTVKEVLVKEGDSVQAGAPLARLATDALELQLAQSKATLAQAQAAYAKIAAGATEGQVLAQQAQVRSAQAQLERSRTGNTTAADVASAQAQLRAAQARLAALKNPAVANVNAAQNVIIQAQHALEAARTNASATKTTAELAMQQAGDALTKAQASYATAQANWNYVQETGNDPANPSITDPATGKSRDNKLSDVQKRQYAEIAVQAEAGLRSSEKALTQAQLSYDTARQNEVIQVQQAETALANAQQQLDALKNPSANDIAQVQASVDQARAALQKSQQGGTKADAAVAQAAVDQSQVNLDQLSTPPRTVDLAEAQARIAAAEVGVQQAERNLAQATLRAPFAGTIAERQIEVGQQLGGNPTAPAPFVLADFATWRIETSNLNERDVVRVQVGSAARITFDALPDLILEGAITAIRPRGNDQYGDMLYTVTVTPATTDARLRWNMSASVAIEPRAR